MEREGPFSRGEGRHGGPGEGLRGGWLYSSDVEQVSRMVAILIIFWPLQSRYNLDENVVKQREVVGNVDDDTDEELLKQVGSSFFYPCLKFN